MARRTGKSVQRVDDRVQKIAERTVYIRRSLAIFHSVLASSVSAPPTDFSKLRLLFAEDDGDAILLFSRLLGKCTAKAKHAPNGAIAIEYLTPYTAPRGDEFAPHAIFLDIKMPYRTGFEVLTWIRSQPALDRTTVVMLSSSIRASDLEQARAAGANAYYEKFPSPEGLIELLTAIATQTEPIGRQRLSAPGLL